MCVRGRRRRIQLLTLRKGDQWVEGVDEIKNEVKCHFQNFFLEHNESRPVLDGVHFSQISEDDNVVLIAPFTMEEIKEAVWSCEGDKSPGPDGFNFNFYKQFWELIKSELVCDFVQEFFYNARFPKAVTASLIALIPKTDHPQSLSEYRPISLIGSMYKIVAKLLASRFKSVLGKVISKCQSAFLFGRQILDGVVVVNEMIDLVKKRRDECLLLKMDFEKAYDSVSWSFMDYMLGRLGFNSLWRKWMRACAASGSISVLVNGSPIVDFDVKKGLRQGDPLAPFLFLVVAEGLAGLVRSAVDKGHLAGYKVNDDISFPLFQFADDTILICEASRSNLWATKTIFRSFELVSGLKVNFSKSYMYAINADNFFPNNVAEFLSCKVGKLPFKFLGIQMATNLRRCSTREPIVTSLKKRLQKWKGRFLSNGGRVTLINSVLNSMPLYLFSFYKAPKKILKTITSIQ